jgi:hypothetical protein
VLDESVLEEPVLEEPVLEEPVLDEPVLDEPFLDRPVLGALAVLLVGVAMATDVLSVRRKRRPKPTLNSPAGYLPPPTGMRQARGSTQKRQGEPPPGALRRE